MVTAVPSGFVVQAPAKLNLFLEVLARRDDGYHELETLLVAIDISDTIHFSPAEKGPIELRCETAAGRAARERAAGLPGGWMGDVPGGDQNLVVRALSRLRDEAGIRAGGTIELTKRIPAAAGLGGASSDAAAALMAAHDAWGLRWSRHDLADLSAHLGSDIPFFFGTGAAVGRGRGERLEWLTIPAAMHVVVARPPVGLRTAEVYRACSPARAPVGVAPVVDALERGRWDQVAQRLWNRLEPAAERLTPWMGRMRGAMERAGCLGCQMTGSGTSWFGICRHAGHAQRVAARLRNAGLGYVVTATTRTGSPPRAHGASATEGGPHANH